MDNQTLLVLILVMQAITLLLVLAPWSRRP